MIPGDLRSRWGGFDARAWFLFQVLAVGIVAWMAWLLWGYSFGTLTNEYHVTLVLKESGLARFHGDSLASGIGGYASPLWWVVGLAARYIDITPLFLAGFIVSRAAFAWGFGALVSALVGGGLSDRRNAWVAGAFLSLAKAWMVPLPIGGDPVLGAYFSQTFLSISLLLLAISMSQERPLRSALFLGLAMDCNIMQSVFGALVIGMVWLASPGNGTARRISAMLRNVSVSALVALPAIILSIRAISGSAGTPGWDGRRLSEWARFWLGGHFFFDFHDSGRALSALVLASAPPLLWGWRRMAGQRTMVPAFATLVPALLAVLQLLIVDDHPTRLLFQLHLFRSDVLAYCLAVAFAASLAFGTLREESKGMFAAAAASLLLLGGFLVSAFAVVLAGVVASLRLPRWIGASIVILILAFHGGWDCAHGLRIAGLVELAVIPGLIGWSFPRRFKALPVVLLGVVLIQTTLVFAFREWNGGAKGSRQGSELARIRAASPQDAVFLLPPSLNARPFLRRGVWFNFYDGASFLWSRGSEEEVSRRMGILGIGFVPGSKVSLDLMDAQWEAGLCRSLPLVVREGVTRVVIRDPDRIGRLLDLEPMQAFQRLGCEDRVPIKSREAHAASISSIESAGASF